MDSMRIADLIAAAVAGGGLTAAFSYLRARLTVGVQKAELAVKENRLAVEETVLARAALTAHFERTERTLKEQAAALETQAKEIAALRARVEHAEGAAEHAEARAQAAEDQRDATAQANERLATEVGSLRAALDAAVQRITTLERERNEAQKELARRQDNEARAEVVR